MLLLPLLGKAQAELTEGCEAANITATYCRLGSTGSQIQVTIDNFSNFSPSDWSGSYLGLGHNGIPGRWPLALTWISANTLVFTISSQDWHTIDYTDPNTDSCGYRLSIFPSNQIPSCDPACNGWDILANIKPCEKATFQALNQPNPFPPGTVVTAKANTRAVALNSDFQFSYDPEKDGSRRWLSVCFTVDQPDCPPYEICKNYFIPACEAPNDKHLEGRSNDADKAAADALRYTNPADQYILFSQTLENAQVTLFTIQGVQVRSISSENMDRVPVADLPNGQYLLSIRRADGAPKTTMILIMHK